jgi:ribosome-binding protein aMBF1 (putative translation factor)
MSHQDWDPVVIHTKSKPISKSALQNAVGSKHIKELENATEASKPKELSISDRQIIISMRAAKGLKQDQLAQALAMPASLYKNIENGKITPTQQQLNKINNYLRCNIKLT